MDNFKLSKTKNQDKVYIKKMQKNAKIAILHHLDENPEKSEKMRKIEKIENFRSPPQFGWVGTAAAAGTGMGKSRARAAGVWDSL